MLFIYSARTTDVEMLKLSKVAIVRPHQIKVVVVVVQTGIHLSV